MTRSFTAAQAAAFALDIQLFGRASPALRDAIAADAEALGLFLGTTCTPRFTSP